MSLKDPVLKIVVYEGPGARPLEPETRYAAAQAVLEKGHSVSFVADRDSSKLELTGPLLVMGLFDGNPPSDHSDPYPKEFHDLSDPDPEAIRNRVERMREKTQAAAHGEWKPWFPVIDYSRCTNCMQCLSFCLFDVYGVDEEQRIQVQNNDNCKTNCPACSRVCPEAAIMFPKYRTGPINGEPVRAEDLNREKMKVDISSLLGGDVYSMLRDRSERAKSRFSKERDSDKALKERQKCLVKLKESVDIPPEVMMALPSQEEILERAAKAKAKAEQALSANQAK